MQATKRDSHVADATTRLAVIGGVIGPILFAVLVVVGGILYDGYSHTSQKVSELGGAVMQAPLTNILMLFELTNDYTLILPIMVTCIVSSYTFQRFTKHSLYVQYLLNMGINIRHGREVSIMNSIKVRDVMNTEFTTIAQEMPFRKILETISYSKNFNALFLSN